MKKVLSAALIIVLLFSCVFLTGCGKSDDDIPVGNIAVTVIVSTGFANSFNNSIMEGVEKVREELDITARYVECKSNDVLEENLRNAAEDSNLVIAVGEEFNTIGSVASDYPRVKFIMLNGETFDVNEHSNLLCVTFSQNEASFLAGYIAANYTESGVVGVVGAYDNDTVNDFIVGYEQGVKYFDSTIEVVKRYVNDYDDVELAKQCAVDLNNQGADVIFQVASNAGAGVFQAAMERKFYAIGVEQDQKLQYEIYDPFILCSVIKEMKLVAYDLVKNYAESRTFEGANTRVASLAEGYVGIAYGSEGSAQIVSDVVKANAETLKNEIISGGFVVDTTRG